MRRGAGFSMSGFSTSGLSKAGLLTLAFAPCVSCYSPAQEPLELALEAVGSAPTRVALRDRGELELTRADLAFGPLSLCPGSQAGALCDTARMEWLQTARIDALSGSVQQLGRLDGVSGPVRSYMYDLGVVSLLGEPGTEYVSPLVEQQGGSLVLEGAADIEGRRVPFAAHVVVRSAADGEQGVPVVRKSSSETFAYELTSKSSALRVHFDASAWVRGLASTDFVEYATCGSGAEVVCQDDVELSCDADAEEAGRRDCAAFGLVCAPARGCAERVEIQPNSAAYRALVQALTSGERPRFELR